MLSAGDAQLQRQQQAGQPRLNEAAVAAAVAAAVGAALGDDVSPEAPLLQVTLLRPLGTSRQLAVDVLFSLRTSLGVTRTA